MAKKWLAVILALGIFFAFELPVSAKDSPPGASESAGGSAEHNTVGELTVAPDSALPSPGNSAAAFRSAAGSAPVVAFYGESLSSLGQGGNLAAIYDVLAANAVQPTPGVYPVLDFAVVTGDPYTGPRQEGVAPAGAQSVKAVQAAVAQAFGAFLADYPSVFWLENVTVRMTANSDYSQITGISLVIDDSSLPGEYKTLGWTEVRLDQTRLSTAAEAFLNELSLDKGMARADRLRAVHDKLVREIRYDTPAAAGLAPGSVVANARPFSVTGALLDREAVCDGYAKALQLICGTLNIPCLYVAGDGNNGKMSGPHAWDYVQLEDGAWYAIDTTWDDLDTAETVSDRYFLVGQSLLTDHFAYPGFGGSLPALSPTDYPVASQPEGPPSPITYFQVKSKYDDEKGAVAVMPPRVTSGGSVDVIVFPYKGYQVKSVTIDDWPQELSSEGGTFTLSNIGKNLRLTAEFEPLAVEGPSISVVPPNGAFNIWKLRADLADPSSSGLLLLATEPFDLPTALLGAAKEAAKPIEMVFRNAAQEFQYGWRFEGASIRSPEIDVNLGVSVAPLKENPELHSLVGRDDGLIVSFAHGGLLPGPASVSVRVSTAYANGRSISCYNYDPARKQFALLAQNLIVQNGAVTFPLERCGELVLTGKPIENALAPEKPDAPATPETASGPSTPNPDTGDAPSAGGLGFLCAAGLALAIRRRLCGDANS